MLYPDEAAEASRVWEAPLAGDLDLAWEASREAGLGCKQSEAMSQGWQAHGSSDATWEHTAGVMTHATHCRCDDTLEHTSNVMTHAVHRSQ